MPDSPDKRFQQFARILAGSVLSGGLIWWCLQGVDFHALLVAIRDVPIGAVIGALLVLWISLPLRAYQWHTLLREPKTPFMLLLRLTCIGFAANLFMPLRGGEAVKGVLLHRWGKLPVRNVVMSLVLCRFQDLPPIGVAFLFAIFHYRRVGPTVRWPSLEHWNVAFIWVILVIFAATALGLFAATVLWQRRLRAWSATLGRRVGSALAAFPSMRAFALGQAIAFICWALFALSAVPLLGLVGFQGWQESLWASIIITVWGTAAAVLPAAPGGIGTIHAACLAALYSLRPGIDRENALAFAVVLHMVGTLGPALPVVFFLPWRKKS